MGPSDGAILCRERCKHVGRPVVGCQKTLPGFHQVGKINNVTHIPPKIALCRTKNVDSPGSRHTPDRDLGGALDGNLALDRIRFYCPAWLRMRGFSKSTDRRQTDQTARISLFIWVSVFRWFAVNWSRNRHPQPVAQMSFHQFNFVWSPAFIDPCLGCDDRPASECPDA